MWIFTVTSDLEFLRIPSLKSNSQKFQMQMKLDLEFLGIPRNFNLQGFKAQKFLEIPRNS